MNLNKAFNSKKCNKIIKDLTDEALSWNPLDELFKKDKITDILNYQTEFNKRHSNFKV